PPPRLSPIVSKWSSPERTYFPKAEDPFCFFVGKLPLSVTTTVRSWSRLFRIRSKRATKIFRYTQPFYFWWLKNSIISANDSSDSLLISLGCYNCRLFSFPYSL